MESWSVEMWVWWSIDAMIALVAIALVLNAES
jgi:hypothetical protein